MNCLAVQLSLSLDSCEHLAFFSEKICYFADIAKVFVQELVLLLTEIFGFFLEVHCGLCELVVFRDCVPEDLPVSLLLCLNHLFDFVS